MEIIEREKKISEVEEILGKLRHERAELIKQELKWDTYDKDYEEKILPRLTEEQRERKEFWVTPAERAESVNKSQEKQLNLTGRILELEQQLKELEAASEKGSKEAKQQKGDDTSRRRNDVEAPKKTRKRAGPISSVALQEAKNYCRDESKKRGVMPVIVCVEYLKTHKIIGKPKYTAQKLAQYIASDRYQKS